MRDMIRWFLIPFFSALAYVLFFRLNGALFGWLEFSAGVNWVFLPSGLRLMLVLLWGPWAALGLVVMWAGDMLGTLLLLYAFKGAIYGVDSFRKDFSQQDPESSSPKGR